jgi:hypothetical protein
LGHGTGWAALTAALALAGCGGGSVTPGARSGVSASPLPRVEAPAAAPSASRPTKVLTIVEENHGQASALRGMPYLSFLARSYGRTTAYRSLTHPSLPNYLALAGGSTFGVHDDVAPAHHRIAGPSVFDVALRARRTAKTYAEAMARPCQAAAAGRYGVKHNPWVYFADGPSRRACARYDVPAGTTSSGALRADIVRGTLPHVGLVVPDICHDAHDCPLGTADSWLRGWVHLVLSGPDYRAGRLALVVTFDESEGGAGGDVLTVVVAPSLHHAVVGTPLSHLSWCRWMTDLVGARPLRQASGTTSLGRAFAL